MSHFTMKISPILMKGEIEILSKTFVRTQAKLLLCYRWKLKPVSDCFHDLHHIVKPVRVLITNLVSTVHRSFCQHWLTVHWLPPVLYSAF